MGWDGIGMEWDDGVMESQWDVLFAWNLRLTLFHTETQRY